ncbi:MAG: beta-ketoacyl synthase N-terminal-like domain-containing protein, partial [Mucilaginibacter sp.]
MAVPGRKVAVVGMGGAFPTCTGLDDFTEKLFAGKSMIREWPLALKYGKQMRSSVCGYIT